MSGQADKARRGAGGGKVRYRVEATESAEADFERIPERDWRRIENDLRGLAETPRPRNAVKIDGDIYRLRRGNWRVIYRIYDDRRYVLVGAARRRNEKTYRGYEYLFPG